MYTIKMPGNQELPVSYSNLIKCISDVGKLFKKGNFRFLTIYHNDKLLKKLVNPRFKEVSKEVFFAGFYDDGFIINDDDSTEYYINN